MMRRLKDKKLIEEKPILILDNLIVMKTPKLENWKIRPAKSKRKGRRGDIK